MKSGTGEVTAVDDAPLSFLLATGQYTGNGGLAQVNAQWIADKLWLGGNGTLVVKPMYGRAVQPPGVPGTVIIR